jgi:hypothetical protein
MTTPVAVNLYGLSVGSASSANFLPYISTVAPSSTNIQGPNGPFGLGQRWIDKVGLNGYELVGLSASNGTISATWTQTSGASQTFTTITVTGLSTLGAVTQLGTLSLNASGAATTTIGGSSGALTINVGSGNMAVVGGGNTIGIGNDAAANTVVLGSTNTTASTTVASGSGGITLTGAVANSSTITSAGNILINGAGKYLGVHHGAVTDFMGTGTLSSGTVMIANTNIATGDMIILSRIAANGSTTFGELSYTISNAASFTVTSLILGTPGSTQTADSSTFSYLIVRPI